MNGTHVRKRIARSRRPGLIEQMNLDELEDESIAAREEAERLQQAFNAAPACELPAAFRVTWEIDIDGVDSHEEAARSALGIQRDPESTATVFRVRRRGEWQPVEVDLQACGQENRVKVGP